MDIVEIETTGARIDEVASLLLSGDIDRPTMSNPSLLSRILSTIMAIIWRAFPAWGAVTGTRVDAHHQSRQRVREHLALVHQCAVEFHSQSASPGTTVLVHTGILINSLFDRYYPLRFVGGAPPPDPEPVFDFLLPVVDADRRQERPPMLETCTMIVLLCLPLSLQYMPFSPGVGDTSSSYALFALHFLAHLKTIWEAKTERRLRAGSISPMPWSISTREPGDQRFVSVEFSRMDPTIVYERACHESGIPVSTADFWHVPPMRWLGAHHDGHPAVVSVYAYVSARYEVGRSGSLLDHAALWQSALTFGVLESITGLIIPQSWFLTTHDDGTVVFTSHQVAALAFTFGRRIYIEPDQTRQRLLADHAFSTIAWAYKALSEELAFEPSHRRSLFWSTGISDSEVDDIACCIYSLLGVFWLTLSTLMRQKSSETGEELSQSHYNSPDDYKDIVRRAHQSYMRRMLEIGWCPYTLAKLSKTDSELAVILGILGMEKPPVRHHPDEHSVCTEDTCTVHNVDISTYTTQHTIPTCSCPFVAPSFTDVDAMLTVDVIPVMTYDGDGLSVRRSTNGPYVAISHVWADGLGSTTERGLPTCQVSRISAFARQLVPDGAFWIDGLCVPEARHLRKSAIRLMARTYRDAEKVIVLDAGIRLHCSMSRTLAENILRIKTSVWMQRVWTIHEAFLAKELCFEFSDGLVAGSTIRQSLPLSGPRAHLSYAWWWILMHVCLDTTILHPAAGQRRRFTDVMHRIASCTTSKPEDVTVAIAGMLGMDVSRILEEPTADARMRVLLLEMRTLSVSIMFSRPLSTYEAERLPFPGFRWAPRNVTAINFSAYIHGSGTATCSSEGLTTEDAFPVLLLTEKFCHRSETYYDGGKRMFAVFDVLQDGRYLFMRRIPTGLRPFDSFEAQEFNALVVRARGPDPDTVFPEAHQSVDVLAVHIPTPALESGGHDTTPLVCEYRFMTELWQPPVPQASSPEGLAQKEPGTSYLCASGRMIRARITLT